MRALALTVTAALTSSAASAVPQRADPFGYKYSREESDRAFESYSECVIRSRSGQEQARRFLRTVPNTPAWAAVGQKLTKPECLSGIGSVRLQFNLTALRPAMFAALYRRRFGKDVPVSLAREAELSLPQLFDGSVANFPRDVLMQLSFGNCVVRADAGAVHTLLMARPWTKDEDAALPAVKQAMGGCLPSGKSIRLTRAGTRGVLAEAMYDISSARAARIAANDNPTEGR